MILSKCIEGTWYLLTFIPVDYLSKFARKEGNLWKKNAKAEYDLQFEIWLNIEKELVENDKMISENYKKESQFEAENLMRDANEMADNLRRAAQKEADDLIEAAKNKSDDKRQND